MFTQFIFHSRFLLAHVLSHRQEGIKAPNNPDRGIFFSQLLYPMFSWIPPILSREIDWQVQPGSPPFRGGLKVTNHDTVVPIPRVFRNQTIDSSFSGESCGQNVFQEGREFGIFTRPEKTFKLFIGNGVLPMEPLLGPIRKAATKERVLLVLLMFLTVGLAVVAGTNVLKPLRRFSAAVTAIMNRDFGRRLPEDRGDEFGDLAKAFNSMASHVEEGRLLSRFVSDSVQTAARSDRSGTGTGKGESIEVVVLFASLGDMGKRIRDDSPTKVISDLNTFLEAGSASVRSKGGDVDKFIGEKLLAVFRVAETGSPAVSILAALKAGEELRTRVRSLPGFADSPIATGLSVGNVLSGILGNPEVRLEMTVLGDTVNLASRLCDLARARGGGTAMDGKARDLLGRSKVGGEFGNPTPLGEVTLKGKSLPVEVFLLTDASAKS
jgi:class 3 adenylate cyclase